MLDACKAVMRCMSLGSLVQLRLLSTLDSAVQLEIKMHEICPDDSSSAGQVCEQEGIVEKLKVGKRQCLALANELDNWREWKIDCELITKAKKIIEKRGAASTSRIGHWSGCKEASCQSELQAAMDALKGIAGGRQDGRLWTSLVDKKLSWK